VLPRLAHLSLLVLMLPGAAAGSPRARALEPLLRDAAEGDALTVRAAHPASALPDGRLRVLVRLHTSAAPGTLARFDPEPAPGDVVPVRVRPDQLTDLASMPGVLHVEACRLLRPHLDRSLKEVGAAAAHRGAGGLDGEGVIVGVVDTGLDFRHKDFQDAAGRTRLLNLVDFSVKPAKGDPGEKYGARIYTEAEINAQLAADRALGTLAPPLVPHQDRSGHGTHVSGIAAGNGQGAAAGYNPGRYVGVAPGARIIAVQAARGNDAAFHDADVLGAISYIFDRAAALGMPAVVNLSLGTQLGPHDGTSNLATAISAFTGDSRPGRVIVTSAGNDGGRDIHASGYPALGGPSTVTLKIPDYKPTSAQELVHMEIWYGGGDLDVSVTSPAGRTTGPASTGKGMQESHGEGQVKLFNATSGPYPGNGKNMAVLVIKEITGQTPAPGRWTIKLTGAARRYDLWLVNPAISGADGRPRLLGPVDPDVRLSSPGTARGVISVAAYSTRTAWVSRGGAKYALQSARRGEHAFFSATGPTLDGRFVPDVAAPGQMIISAMSLHARPFHGASSYYVPDLPFALWSEDQSRGLLRGTSQAAPHAAGVAALLLQRAPALTVGQVRELLRVGARGDGAMQAGRAWSPRWGFGKLDATRSIAALAAGGAGPAHPTMSTVGVNRDLLPAGSGELAVVTVIPRDAAGRLLGAGRRVEVTTSAGRTSAAVHRAYGRYEATLSPAARQGRRATLAVSVDGVALSHRPVVHFTTRRDLVGEALRARGGGCAAAGAGRQPSPVALLLLMGLVAWRARAARRWPSG